MKKILKYMRPYKGQAFLTIIMTLVNVMATMILPTIMGTIVNDSMAGNVDRLKIKGLQMMGITILAVLAMIVAAYYSSKVSSQVGTDIRRDLFHKVQGLSQAQMNEIGVSSLITRTTTDVDELRMMTITSLRMIVRAPLMFLVGTIIAFNHSKELSLILIGTMPLIALFVYLIGSRAVPLFKENQKRLDGINKVVRSNVTGVRTIRAYNKEEYEMGRFEAANQSLRDLNLKLNRLMSIMSPGVFLLMHYIMLGVVLMASRQIDLGLLSIGDLMAYTQQIFMILFSVVMISIIFIMVPRAEVSAKRIDEVMEKINLIEQDRTGQLASGPLSVEYDQVFYRFEDAEDCQLYDINFQAQAGDTIAIIGSTGSGKSILVNLLLRFYDPVHGKILVNGLDLKDWDLDQLRAKIGHVPQNAVLFSGTIRSNLAKAAPGKSEEEMIEALKIAQAWDFVEELPDQLDARVDQAGANFSGGQKQRLAIARAVLRAPEIYIFDDSFSALDFQTERKLQDQLALSTQESICFMIAQRISTVENADLIIVLDGGRVDGMGKHEDLLAQSRVYREIYQSQRKEG